MKATEAGSLDVDCDGPVDSPSERTLSSCTSLHVKSLSAGERDVSAPVRLIWGVGFCFLAMVPSFSRSVVSVSPAGHSHRHVRWTSLTYSMPSSVLICHATPSGMETILRLAECPFALSFNSSTTQIRFSSLRTIDITHRLNSAPTLPRKWASVPPDRFLATHLVAPMLVVVGTPYG